jgi:hypothetical protein
LGENQIIDSLFVVWPNDKSQKISNVKVNQTLNIDIKNADLDWKFNPTPSGIKYLTNSQTINYEHVENQFNDFTVQTLLPNYLFRFHSILTRHLVHQ